MKQGSETYERSEIRVRGTGRKLPHPIDIYEVYGRGKCEYCEYPASTTVAGPPKRQLCCVCASKDLEACRETIDWANQHGDHRLARMANRTLMQLERDALLFGPVR